MISFTSFMIIIAIVLVTITFLLTRKTELFLENFIYPLFIFFIVFFAIKITIQNDSIEIKDVVRFENKQEVLSLNDSFHTSTNADGSFLLGTGSIVVREKQISVYNALVGNSEIGYKMKSFDMEDTSVFFDEDDKPYIHTKVVEGINQFNRSWLNGGLLTFRDKIVRLKSQSVELHLPKNTQKVTYEIDLE